MTTYTVTERTGARKAGGKTGDAPYHGHGRSLHLPVQPPLERLPRCQTRPKGIAAPLQSAGGRIETLQRSQGNHAALRLLRSGVFQAKLTVSRPDDIHEQEADRVANEVMRMPGPVVQTKPG